MNIHKMALSHIVATDYHTMITLVGQIKEEEAALDVMLADYEDYVTPDDQMVYETLLTDYEAFKHALVELVCASANSRHRMPIPVPTAMWPLSAMPWKTESTA